MSISIKVGLVSNKTLKSTRNLPGFLSAALSHRRGRFRNGGETNHRQTWPNIVELFNLKQLTSILLLPMLAAKTNSTCFFASRHLDMFVEHHRELGRQLKSLSYNSKSDIQNLWPYVRSFGKKTGKTIPRHIRGKTKKCTTVFSPKVRQDNCLQPALEVRHSAFRFLKCCWRWPRSEAADHFDHQPKVPLALCFGAKW